MITRELKNAIYSYDEETKTFRIGVDDKSVWLNKVQMFSLMRFMIRVTYKMTMKKRKTKAVELEESLDESLES